MKVLRYQRANPIYRDLALVILAGLLASIAVVTMGYVALTQVLR